MTKGALILFSLALLFEQIRLGGEMVDTITFVFYILAGVMLFISVCIGIYAKQTLEKARDFFHFAWDLTQEEDTKELAHRLASKLTERANEDHNADSDFHSVGGTD